MTEDQLQQECFLYFHSTYKNLRGRLFRTENKTNRNAKGLGLVKGVADLQFVLPDGKLVPIELKVNGSNHKLPHLQTQLDWVRLVSALSGLGFFCFSFDHFKQVIDSLVNYDKNKYFLTNESANSKNAIQNLIYDAQLRGVKSTTLIYKIGNYDPKK